VILLDADVILIDRKFTTDNRYAINRAALDRLRVDLHTVAMVAHAVLEVVGVMSHGTPAADVPLIPDALRSLFGILIIPSPAVDPNYAQSTFEELLLQMSHKMSLGDAVQAVQVAKFASPADTLLTWNAKHFRGKLTVPVLTPEEWLQQQPPARTTSPTGPTP